jgi:hypothetical protein
MIQGFSLPAALTFLDKMLSQKLAREHFSNLFQINKLTQNTQSKCSPLYRIGAWAQLSEQRSTPLLPRGAKLPTPRATPRMKWIIVS